MLIEGGDFSFVIIVVPRFFSIDGESKTVSYHRDAKKREKEE